jgi:hypothetical protein
MKTSEILLFAAIALGAYYLLHKTTAAAAAPSQTNQVVTSAVDTATTDLIDWLQGTGNNTGSTNSTAA